MTEQNVALDDAGQDTQGDWGEGTGALEQKLLEGTESDEAIEGQDKLETPSEGADGQKAGEEGVSRETPQLFDLDGKLSLKAGEKLSQDHIKELERGWMREHDYTQKTQQIAEERKAAQEILTAQDLILKDPRNLFNYFEPKHILNAFTREEMLNFGLNAAGVQPQVWDKFLDWYKESGDMPQNVAHPKTDPYAEKWSKVERELNDLRQWRGNYEKRTQEQREELSFQETKAKYDAEIDSAIKKYPSADKEAILTKMATSKEVKPIEQIAKDIHQRNEDRFNEYVKTKKIQRESGVKPAKGVSVQIMQRPPSTMAEADDMAERFLANMKGSL